jgi:predicted nucleic acid-binding protein
MSVYTALLDANVLYPAPVRDIFIQLAVTDIYHAKWSAAIHDEWMRSLLRDKPRLDRAVLERTRDLMDRAVRDCFVTGYEALIPALTLPDPDDRHVLAAAIAGRCDVIVTQTLRDFPAEALAPYGLEKNCTWPMRERLPHG